MRLSTPSALVALLGTCVSGNILSAQAASCNSEPISTGGGGSLEQLNSATREACAKWLKNDNIASTFNSAAFNLSFDGATGITDNGACVSAFATILKSCASDVIFGGSIRSQGVKYTIGAAETDSDLHSELVARAPVKKKRAAADKAKKTAADKAKKAADDKAKKAADEKAKKAAAEKKKNPAAVPQAGPACNKRKGTQAANSGTKGKGTPAPKPAHGTLRVRAFLLDLIKRASKFSGRKDFTFGSKYLLSDPYPPQSSLSDKVLLYGFSNDNELKTLFGPKENLNTDEAGDLDVEHILEWHNVGEFLFDQHPSEIEKILPEDLDEYNNKDGCQEVFEITIDKSKKTGTFSQMVAAAYPATTHFKKEFVLLDRKANSQVKLNVMRNKAPISTDKWTGSQEDLLLKLRDVLTVGLYLVDDKVSGFFSQEVQRMGNAFHQLEAEMIKKDIIKKAKGQGLQKEWLEHMDKVWDEAKTQLISFMDEKVKELKKTLREKLEEELRKESKDPKKDLRCTFDVKIKGSGKVSMPDPDTTPANVADNKCKALEFMHDNWVKFVKEKIGTRPWASAGDKRPAGPTPKTSSSSVPTTKKGKKPGSG